MKIYDKLKQTYGSMTHEEKLMNRADLNYYKTNDNKHTEALIPGINNLSSVGTSPLKRGARQILARH